MIEQVGSLQKKKLYNAEEHAFSGKDQEWRSLPSGYLLLYN